MNTRVETLSGQSSSWVDSRWFERLLELLPGLLTWFFLLGPIVFSFLIPVAVAYFIIAFDLIWLVKSLRLSSFLVIGYSKLHRRQQFDWQARMHDLEDIPGAIKARQAALNTFLSQRAANLKPWRWSRTDRRLRRLAQDQRAYVAQLKGLDVGQVLKPSQLYNAVIIATYNESLKTLEPSVRAILEVNYPLKQLMLVIAYEERGGPETEANAKYLIKKYGSMFGYATAIKHPDGLAGEGRVKGANMSYAARQFSQVIEERGIPAEQVIVTSFDSDHRPDPNYFAALSFEYAINPTRIHRSFQPIPMFYNNIWDAPAPMRLIATGNSFWMIMQTVRPHLLRNFAAHAQSLQTLRDTNYWHLTSIVEDGHQFWRSYFRYHGDHAVVPLYVPVYQDAVLSKTYLATFKAQYIQLRRWAWGISDFPYVVRNSIKDHSIPLGEKVQQIFRLVEGHFSWATAPLILTFVAWLPLYLNRNFADQVLAHELPVIASRILSLAMIGLIATVIISLISLPPRPSRYRYTRRIGTFFIMLFQWVILLPLTAIVFSAFAAIDAQTRLMIGWYLDWKVTEKATKR